MPETTIWITIGLSWFPDNFHFSRKNLEKPDSNILYKNRFPIFVSEWPQIEFMRVEKQKVSYEMKYGEKLSNQFPYISYKVKHSYSFQSCLKPRSVIFVAAKEPFLVTLCRCFKRQICCKEEEESLEQAKGTCSRKYILLLL